MTVRGVSNRISHILRRGPPSKKVRRRLGSPLSLSYLPSKALLPTQASCGKLRRDGIDGVYTGTRTNARKHTHLPPSQPPVMWRPEVRVQDWVSVGHPCPRIPPWACPLSAEGATAGDFL